VAALCASLERPPRFVFGTLIVFYLAFAVIRVTPGFSLGSLYHATNVKTERLTLARSGNLRIDPVDAQLYEKLIPTIQSHATNSYIYAAPDCPEVYFLAGLRNPTRTFFDYRDEIVGRNERILRTIEGHGVSVVVIDREAQFFGTLEPDLVTVLEERYPVSEEIGHFQVRWRTNDSAHKY
jgi:hypothetical protein